MGRVIQVVNAGFAGSINATVVIVLGPLDGRGVLSEVAWRVTRGAGPVPFEYGKYEIAVVLSGSSSEAVEDVRDGRGLIDRSTDRGIQRQPTIIEWLGIGVDVVTRLPVWVGLDGRPDYVLVALLGASLTVDVLCWATVVEDDRPWWLVRSPATPGAVEVGGG